MYTKKYGNISIITIYVIWINLARGDEHEMHFKFPYHEAKNGLATCKAVLQMIKLTITRKFSTNCLLRI
jgi:hypothetical protein